MKSLNPITASFYWSLVWSGIKTVNVLRTQHFTFLWVFAEVKTPEPGQPKTYDIQEA